MSDAPAEQQPQETPSHPENAAYPEALRCREEELIAHRRGNTEGRCEPRVGLALSGGGIRSATFSFGFLQALARRKVLKEVDVLSTVSGGGYTGGMLTRLCSRHEVGSPEDVARAILPEGATPGEAEQARKGNDGSPTRSIRSGAVLRWLRENGHHLAPNGAGDLLLGGAVIFRNWLSLHVVLGTLLLTVFVAMQLGRLAFDTVAPGVRSCTSVEPEATALLTALLACGIPLGQHYMWWSPWLGLAGLLFVLWPAPCGLAYWLMASRRAARYSNAPMVFAVLAGLAFAFWLLSDETPQLVSPGPLALATAFGIVVISFIGYDVAMRRSGCRRRWREPERLELSHRLSSWLKSGLVVFAIVAGLAVADTLGQTLYVFAIDPGSSLPGLVGGAFGALAALAEGGRRLVVRFRGDGESQTPARPLKVAGFTVAALIVVAVPVSLNALSHALAWNFEYPAGVPGEIGTSQGKHRACEAGVSQPCIEAVAPHKMRCLECTSSGQRLPTRLTAYLLVLSGFTLLFGRGYRFLNDSTLQPLYRARIVRAYFGASNPKRIGSDRSFPVTQMIECDDTWMDWDQPDNTSGPDPLNKYTNGAPLHLVNVTINETVEGKSRLHRRDRRGVGMTVGPAGISAGVKHHAVFASRPSEQTGRLVQVFPEGEAPHTFRMFEYAGKADGRKGSGWLSFGGESLTFGQWIGISGAAFSTGIGMRTNLALSFLAGILNVRLGYWWDSGVKPRWRHALQRSVGANDECKAGPRATPGGDSWASRGLAKWLPVQSYLLEELFAQFRGGERQRWNLSDGGHFENLGGYELIRRQVPLIIIVDAEADPVYRFEGLGNLVRKARVDFGAEIEFLDQEALCSLREVPNEMSDDADWLSRVGSLDMLRRGSQDAKANRGKEGSDSPSFSAPDRSSTSRAHVALAIARYAAGHALSLIVYVKPTLMGDEPADLQHYHDAHPDFPQQTTKDQFFDEAQWESYRALGELVGLRCLPETTPFTALLDLREKLEQI